VRKKRSIEAEAGCGLEADCPAIGRRPADSAKARPACAWRSQATRPTSRALPDPFSILPFTPAKEAGQPPGLAGLARGRRLRRAPTPVGDSAGELHELHAHDDPAAEGSEGARKVTKVTPIHMNGAAPRRAALARWWRNRRWKERADAGTDWACRTAARFGPGGEWPLKRSDGLKRTTIRLLGGDCPNCVLCPRSLCPRSSRLG
jgi:hypothetical protein